MRKEEGRKAGLGEWMGGPRALTCSPGRAWERREERTLRREQRARSLVLRSWAPWGSYVVGHLPRTSSWASGTVSSLSAPGSSPAPTPSRLLASPLRGSGGRGCPDAPAGGSAPRASRSAPSEAPRGGDTGGPHALPAGRSAAGGGLGPRWERVGGSQAEPLKGSRTPLHCGGHISLLLLL